MWQHALVIVGGSVVLAVAACFLVNKFVPVERRAEYNEVSGNIFAAAGAFYTVLLAFVVVAVWEDLSESTKNIYAEANALPGLYYSATAFPDEQRDELQAVVVAYARSVIADEWPLLAHGEASPKVEEAAKGLRRALLRLEPEGGKQEVLYGAMIERINTINSSRRERLNEAEPSIPGFFWVGLLGGGLLVVAFGLFFGTPRPLPHGLMVGVLTLLVAASLFLAHEMDHPFRGTVSVTPEAFQLALQQMGQAPP